MENERKDAHTYTQKTNGQTDRQVNKHTDKQTDRQTDGQTYRQTDRQTDRWTNIQTNRQLFITLGCCTNSVIIFQQLLAPNCTATYTSYYNIILKTCTQHTLVYRVHWYTGNVVYL